MPKRTQRFKLADATGKATQLVGDVLREIPTSPIFSKPFRNAQLAVILVTALLAALHHPVNTAIIGSYRDINLNELLFKKISTSYLIQQYWANLVDKNLSCAESAELFKVTINYFVSIRVRAFVLVYTDFKKLTDKAITKKGTRSLRQQLSK